MKKLKIIIFILVVGGVIGVIVALRVFKKAEISVASAKAELAIGASPLTQQFENNEDSANALYLGKIIEVSGTINSISDNEQGISIYLKNNGESSGVMCSFGKGTIKTSELSQGQSVKIKGICNGYLLDVVLNKCAISK